MGRPFYDDPEWGSRTDYPLLVNPKELEWLSKVFGPPEKDMIKVMQDVAKLDNKVEGVKTDPYNYTKFERVYRGLQVLNTYEDPTVFSSPLAPHLMYVSGVVSEDDKSRLKKYGWAWSEKHEAWYIYL